MQALEGQRNHRRRTDLTALALAEQERQLMGTQHAAHGLAARQQAADGLVRFAAAH
ncbi:hypothetical protein D3C77_814570 [compost metagenome]